MPIFNNSLIPSVSAGRIIDRFLSDETLNVRWLTPEDPAHFSALNRPLSDLALRQLVIAKVLDTITLDLKFVEKFPFVCQPVVEGGSFTLDLPLKLIRDLHVAFPAKYANPRLARIDRLNGSNDSGTDPKYTGTLRFIFIADSGDGSDVALFYADYLIDSSDDLQFVSVEAASDQSKVPGLTPLPSEDSGFITGVMIFRTGDQDLSDITTFYDFVAPSDVNGIANYPILDAQSCEINIGTDVLDSGSGLLTSSAYNQIISGINIEPAAESGITVEFDEDQNAFIIGLDQSQIDHTQIANIGVNTHDQIDAHIINTNNPHQVTPTQLGNGSPIWNTNKIQSRNVSNQAPEDGQALIFDQATNQYIPSDVAASGGGSGNVVERTVFIDPVTVDESDSSDTKAFTTFDASDFVDNDAVAVVLQAKGDGVAGVAGSLSWVGFTAHQSEPLGRGAGSLNIPIYPGVVEVSRSDGVQTYAYDVSGFVGSGFNQSQLTFIQIHAYIDIGTAGASSSDFIRIQARWPDGSFRDLAVGRADGGDDSRHGKTLLVPIAPGQTQFEIRIEQTWDDDGGWVYQILGAVQQGGAQGGSSAGQITVRKEDGEPEYNLIIASDGSEQAIFPLASDKSFEYAVPAGFADGYKIELIGYIRRSLDGRSIPRDLAGRTFLPADSSSTRFHRVGGFGTGSSSHFKNIDRLEKNPNMNNRFDYWAKRVNLNTGLTNEAVPENATHVMLRVLADYNLLGSDEVTLHIGKFDNSLPESYTGSTFNDANLIGTTQATSFINTPGTDKALALSRTATTNLDQQGSTVVVPIEPEDTNHITWLLGLRDIADNTSLDFTIYVEGYYLRESQTIVDDSESTDTGGDTGPGGILLADLLQDPNFYDHLSGNLGNQNSGMTTKGEALPFTEVPQSEQTIVIDPDNARRVAILRVDIRYSATGNGDPLTFRLRSTTAGDTYTRWVTDLYRAGNGDRPHAGFSSTVLIPLDDSGAVRVTAFAQDINAAFYRLQLEGFASNEGGGGDGGGGATPPPAIVSGLITGSIGGLLMRQSTGDPDNDIVITSGSCVDANETILMRVTGTLIKRLDAPWSEGTNDGGLASSLSVQPNRTYHVFLIAKPDGTVDGGFDEDVSASALLADGSPSGYTTYRRVGSIETDGNSRIRDFVSNETPGGGLEILWSQDRTKPLSTVGSGGFFELNVPFGVSYEAIINARLSGQGGNGGELRITTPSGPIHNSDVPAIEIGGSFIRDSDQTDNFILSSQLRVRTNAAKQVVVSISGDDDESEVTTIGFIDSRRQI